MIAKDLLEYMEELAGEEGKKALDKTMIQCGYEDSTLDSLPDEDKRLFASMLLDNSPVFSIRKISQLYSAFLDIMGLPNTLTEMGSKIDLIRPQKVVLPPEKEFPHIDSMLKKKFRVEHFWTDVKKAYSKTEALVKIYWSKAKDLKKQGIDTSFMYEPLQKDFEELKEELNLSYENLMRDLELNIQEKDERLPSSFFDITNDDYFTIKLSPEQEVLKKNLNMFWRLTHNQFLDVLIIFNRFLKQEIIGRDALEDHTSPFEIQKDLTDLWKKIQEEYLSFLDVNFSYLSLKKGMEEKQDQGN